MSRSYKKYPFVKDRNSAKWGKRYCNKRVRKTKDIPNGRAYKKLTEPWDFIYDYCHSETKAEVIQKWESAQKDKANGVSNYINWYRDETLEEALLDWKKSYINK